MNQDFQPIDSMFQMPPPVKNAAYYRAEARKRLKAFWGIAILATLIAMLLGGISASFSFDFDLEGTATELTNADDFSAGIAAAVESGNLLEYLFTIPAVGFGLMLAGIAAFTAIAMSVFVSPPVAVGYRRFTLALADQNAEEVRVATLFRFFRQSYWKTIGLKLLHGLIMLATAIPAIICIVAGFFVSLGTFLFTASAGDYTLFDLLGAIILFFLWVGVGVLISWLISLPVSYMYTFAFMIMAEYPTVGTVEALRASRQLMKGHKWKLFCLDLSFIGWKLLAALLTMGIGMIVVHPYNEAARAVFYSDIAKRETAKETEFPSLDPNDYSI